MGLFGSAGAFAAKVLVEYKGDTKDLTKKMRGLKGEEKKLARARKDSVEEANKRIEGQIGMIGRATIAVGAMAAAWYGASKAMEAWAKDAQLRHAATGMSMDKLRKASHGLLTEQQLLKVAAAALNGQFKGTQEELEAVVGGIAQLTHEGNDLEQVVNVLAKSLAENGVEELQQFGIAVRDATGAIAVKGTGEARETMLGAMTELNEKFEGIKADEAVRSLNKVKDATHDLSVEIGKLSSAVTDAVLNIGTNVGELAFQMQTDPDRRAIFDFLGVGTPMEALGKAEQGRRAMAALARQAEAERKFWTEWTQAGSLQEQAEARAISQAATERRYRRRFQPVQLDPAMTRVWHGTFQPPPKGPPSPFDLRGKPEPWFARMMGMLPTAAQMGRAGELISPDVLGQFQRGEAERFRTERARGRLDVGYDPAQMMADLDEQMAKFRREEEVSFLENIFGPIEEFDLYKTAFETLSAGMGLAFDAWLQGASIGESLIAGFKQAAKLLSKSLFDEAIRHGAWAVGEAAFQNWPKAAMHAKAAAVFGAGAIAVGGAVRGRGGGGVATAPGTYGGRAQTRQEQRPLVMVFAGDYAADRQEAGDRAFEAMESYKRRNGESNIVVDG